MTLKIARCIDRAQKPAVRNLFKKIAPGTRIEVRVQGVFRARAVNLSKVLPTQPWGERQPGCDPPDVVEE